MIKPAEYVRRRKALMRMAADDAILILPAAPERIRSNEQVQLAYLGDAVA